MAFLKAVFKKRSLTISDNQRTRAAELTLRQSIYPICLVTVLFFLWGFSYGLLDTLNKHFQNTLNITRARSAGLQAAYFGAYPLASLGHANWILRHYGYKPVFIWGLCLYGVGALVAWPCLVHRSFGGFCAAIFIIGNGLGSLETAANPYITVCGPPRYAEMRINISQAFNGIGSVVAPVLGSYVFFLKTADDSQALKNRLTPYSSSIPEITDADMAFQAEETHASSDIKPFWKQYRLFHAAFSQFCYTGAQVAIASYFINYVVESRPNTSSALAAKFLAGAQGGFSLGRFTGVAFMKFIRPRWVFLFYLAMCIVFIAPSITHGGDTGMAFLYVTLFFESICFPTIVALGMRGLGKYTKRGSGYIIAGVSGGACIPPLTGAVADMHNSTAKAMSVPLAFFVAAWSYALCVNFVPAYRDPADQFSTAEIGMGSGAIDEETGKVEADGVLGSVETKEDVAPTPKVNE
ncbi:L-fucose permease [Hyphodiscus hymeniophilus]|uniref:L-fucose permease n=1 Tax=Hyphodiscus hymeniophilus TaxID=353542 RepID=A0A9P6VMX9_9HELO|nr:L-fucose permease [Hyphodiscus hymeniophilus]